MVDIMENSGIYLYRNGDIAVLIYKGELIFNSLL